jgi:hypothetical protein
MSDSQKDPKGKEPKKAARRPQLVTPPDLEPVYANVVRIAHTPSEMVFDFGRLLPGDQDAPIGSRVMMSPLSAKLLQRALAENLAKYETNFGEIKIPQGPSLADHLFRPVQPPNGPEPSEGE